MLQFLASELRLNELLEIGKIVLITLCVFHQGLELSIAKKIALLMSTPREKLTVSIILNNPALLVTSNAVLEGRIQQCPLNLDLATWLLPSAKGRRKTIQQSTSPAGLLELTSPQ